MEEYENEMKIIGNGDPISFKRLEQLKEISENSTCKINYMGKSHLRIYYICILRNLMI